VKPNIKHSVPIFIKHELLSCGKIGRPESCLSDEPCTQLSAADGGQALGTCPLLSSINATKDGSQNARMADVWSNAPFEMVVIADFSARVGQSHEFNEFAVSS